MKRTEDFPSEDSKVRKRLYSPPQDFDISREGSNDPTSEYAPRDTSQDATVTILNTPYPHTCSMARLLDLSLPELELISEFTHHTHPEILKANAQPDLQWMGRPDLLASSRSLKLAFLFLASSDLAQKKTQQVVGRYPQMPVNTQERLLREFTNLLKWFKYESQEPNSLFRRDDILLPTAIYVYLCGLAIGPQLLPFFTSCRQDLAGLCNSIHNTHISFSGEFQPPAVAYPVLPDRMRTLLPKEEDLWAIVDHVLVDENIPTMAERRHIRTVLSTEIYAMIELFNMDVAFRSISHLSSWCVFNTEKFNLLRQEQNPYSTIVIAYYLAYCHLFHSWGWWRDRAQYDLYDVVEYLPDYYMEYVQWPLAVVESFEWTYEDLLDGKFRMDAEKMKSFR
jgi:hypothetical protein